MKKTILICILLLSAWAGIVCGSYGSYKDREDWGPRGDLILAFDEKEVVWYNLDDVYNDDANDANTVSIRASQATDETYYMRWPINSGDPNSVLMTPGDQNAQLVWATIDANLVDVNDGNNVSIALPVLTPGSRIFVDANGFPLFEDNDNAYFDDVNDFAGFALGHIAGDPKPNNYIQVYNLLNFDPDLLNVSVGWARTDNMTGPNNVRIGEGAGGVITSGKQNAVGGKDAGASIVLRDDNAFWGYEAGANVGGGAFTSGDYLYTYFSYNGGLVGVPLGDAALAGSLDASGAAVDKGGGLVGLPYTGHPFNAGETVTVTNTTSYNASYVLDATTSANELVVADTYAAETFDGDEPVVREIGLDSSFGRSAQDNDGNIYYGHIWSAGNSTLCYESRNRWHAGL